MSAFPKNFDPAAAMESALTGFVALLLFIYLFVAMIRPEKF